MYSNYTFYRATLPHSATIILIVWPPTVCLSVVPAYCVEKTRSSCTVPRHSSFLTQTMWRNSVQFTLNWGVKYRWDK